MLKTFSVTVVNIQVFRGNRKKTDKITIPGEMQILERTGLSDRQLVGDPLAWP